MRKRTLSEAGCKVGADQLEIQSWALSKGLFYGRALQSSDLDAAAASVRRLSRSRLNRRQQIEMETEFVTGASRAFDRVWARRNRLPSDFASTAGRLER